MIDSNEQLQLLRDAQRHPAKLALAIVDLIFPELPGTSRAELKTALAAASIPHWFDATILDDLLEPPRSNRDDLLAKMLQLSVVEPFPARGFTAANVHESARFALRKHLARDESERFRMLSARTAGHFEADQSVTGRIEWVYHLLNADPERGVDELVELSRNWLRIAHPEVRYALEAALKELEKTDLLQRRGKLWAHIVSAWNRFLRGQFASLGEAAEKILQEGRSLSDEGAMLHGYALASVAHEAESPLEQALEAAKQAVAIAQRLSDRAPDNLGALQDLASAMNQYGDVLQTMNKPGEARATFIAAHRLTKELVKRAPDRISALRDLAVACNRVGGVLETLPEERAEAEKMFRDGLDINRSLIEKDPENSDWQRELAVAHNRLGGVLQSEERTSEALEQYEKAFEISRKLADLDPLNIGWRRDLAVSHIRRGALFVADGKLENAKEAFEAAVGIFENLDESDRSDPQSELSTAFAYRYLGGILTQLKSFTEARSRFEAALEIYRRLLKLDHTNTDWQRELEETTRAMNASPGDTTIAT